MEIETIWMAFAVWFFGGWMLEIIFSALDFPQDTGYWASAILLVIYIIIYNAREK